MMNQEKGEFSKKPEALKSMSRLPWVLFHPTRVSIMLNLYYMSTADFAQLKRDLDLSDGVLSTHLKILSRSGMIESKKEHEDTRKRKEYSITGKGIVSFEQMAQVMRTVFEGVPS